MTAVVLPLRRPVDPLAYLAEAFGPDGHLARAAGAAYEARPGQLAFARAVDGAIRARAAAFLEGPCGTGKGAGYLVPAIYHATQGATRKRVVVSTASITLQEQLIGKDLPALARALPWRFTFGLLKGRANFVCNDALEAARRDPPVGLLAAPEERQQFGALVRWAAAGGCTGDRADLPFVPVERLWQRLTVDSDDCKGDDCPQRAACFFEGARSAAARADVLVVNHHVLCADQALRQLGAPPLLPTTDVLIVDEAHELPDIAREFFGATLTRGLADRATRYALRVADERAHGVAGPDVDPAGVDALGALFFEALATYARRHAVARVGAATSRHAVRAPLDDGDALAAVDPGVGAWVQAIATLGAHAARRHAALSEREDLDAGERAARAAHRTAARRLGKAATWLAAVHAPGPLDEDLACWAELGAPSEVTGGQAATLQARSLDVTGPLRAIAARSATVLTSATLTVGGAFDFLARETGIAPALTLEVPSPFDFATRCLTVVPARMPPPDAPTWPAKCARVVRSLVDAADGRTLALFSSRANLDRVWAAVAGTSDRPWLRQGDAPPRELARRFRADPRAVLFGLRSFWTGLDVPGEACIAVFIDRIPFPQREDPVVRKLRLRAGSGAFEAVDLPRALMQLRQGFGRLLRSRADFGVVVLGDGRVLSKRWGGEVWASLPATARGASAADIAAFLARFRAADEGAR